MTYILKRGDFLNNGAYRDKDDVTFTFCVKHKAPTNILLFDIDSKELLFTIPLTDEYRIGLMYSVTISGLNWDRLCYLYESDEVSFLDPYACAIIGREKWMDGDRQKDDYRIFGGFYDVHHDWAGDLCPEIAPCDTIIYKLHIRGFTMDHKLHSRQKGNYRGVLACLPYLKELGVTSLEFMPLYEFEEVRYHSHKEMGKNGKATLVTEPPYSTNYWGYGKGYYFAPKASYFGGSDIQHNMKEMVRAIHEEGMEVIMEIAFSGQESDDHIMDVLLFWRKEYHIDGFHILGVGLPSERIAINPFLGEAKIFYDHFPDKVLYDENEDKHLFVYNDAFVFPMRRLQHHMDGSIADFAGVLKRQQEHFGYVNYAATNTGFCLLDVYSYGEKHNLSNGEDNTDGSNYNCSYNHGVEGETKKKNINRIRRLNARTALSAVLLSQGIPMIASGDEVLNTQHGNNNPYCQDNDIGWVNFSGKKSSALFFDYIRQIIEFRKNHPVLHLEEPMHENDHLVKGLPDLSYHGREPWVMGIGAEKKGIGIMYFGAYGTPEYDEDVMLCFNFYYGEETFAVPALPEGRKWYFVTNTGDEEFAPDAEPLKNQSQIIVPPGTLTILAGKDTAK